MQRKIACYSENHIPRTFYHIKEKWYETYSVKEEKKIFAKIEVLSTEG
jgi:hypothetical protein